MNKCILRGNLTRDVELRTTQSGKQIARFSIAVRRDVKNEDGNYESDFINCIAFGKIAETIDKYFHKGSGIIVLGHIQTGSYEKEDGTKVFTTDIVVESIEFDRKENKKEETSQQPTQTEIIQKAMSEDPYVTMGEQVAIDDNDLPF